MPAVFLGERALVGDEEMHARALKTLIAQYADTGAEPVWDDWRAVHVAGRLDGGDPDMKRTHPQNSSPHGKTHKSPEQSLWTRLPLRQIGIIAGVLVLIGAVLFLKARQSPGAIWQSKNRLLSEPPSGTRSRSDKCDCPRDKRRRSFGPI